MQSAVDERRHRIGPAAAAAIPWLAAAGVVAVGIVTSSVFTWIGTGLLSGLSLSGSI